MNESGRIGQQMERAFKGNAWHGSAVLELLKDVTFEQARRRPIADAHSIAEIVSHMTTWKRVVTRRLGGQAVTEVAPDVDWPPSMVQSPQEWDALVSRLRRAHTALATAVRKVRTQDLEQPPKGGTTSRYVLMHGIIQHDLYHAGQIAILKKG